MFNEDMLEQSTMNIFSNLGYEILNGYDLERDYHEVLYLDYIFDDLKRINTSFDDDSIREAIRVIKNFKYNNVVYDNKEFHKYLREGVPVEIQTKDGYIYKNVRLIDFDNIENNHFLAINQYWVNENELKRPDIVVFINGFPLVVVELKTATNEDVTLTDAYNQLQRYKTVSIPTLFRYNEFLVISDGVTAKAGTITSNYQRFSDWKKVNTNDEVKEAMETHTTLFNGMFLKSRLIDLIQNYIMYNDDYKILPQYHQYFGVEKAIDSTMTRGKQTGKAGVLWHTQGSGKSFSMVFYAANMIRLLKNPTIVVVTDRNDLDNQLYSTFLNSVDFLKQTPVQANSREMLTEILKDRQSGGIFFTTLQKFEEETGLFSDRNDILVLVDECHRSHYGLDPIIKIDTDSATAYKKFGVAKYLHDALPNAIYIGFTGTPIETKDRSTSSIFGDVIDTYDMTQAIMDGSTVPIVYESRMAKVGLNQRLLEEIDAYYNEIEANGQADEYTIKKSKQMMATISSVIEDPDRLELIVKDIISHYEERKTMDADHAMVVAYSRKSAYIMYKKFLELRPDYEDKVHMVITPSNKDDEEMQKAIGTKYDKKILENRFKSNDKNEPFKVAIVVDMWLTGFDVPSLGTMYIDKPMKAHNLMQAIARVNRVFKSKTAGLIVDYIGLKGWLLEALKTYTTRDQNKVVDNEEYIKVLKDNVELADNYLFGVDYLDFKSLDNTGKYNKIKEGANHILATNERERLFMSVSSSVKSLFTMCNGVINNDLKDKVLYIISVRSFITKIKHVNKLDVEEINKNVADMLNKAITDDELINLGELSHSNELDLLSAEMVNKLAQMKEKNVAADVLSRAIKTALGKIGKVNVTLQQKFSDRFNKIVEEYNERTSIADIEKVIQELINLRNEITVEINNGNEYNLSIEEKAFFDALGDDPEIKVLMQDDTLVQIAKELVDLINKNLTLDAFKREDARAKIRVEIRRLLVKYDYPPNKSEVAIKKVIRQAELKYSNN